MYKLKVIPHSSVESGAIEDINKLCRCLAVQSPQDLLVQINFAKDNDHEDLYGVICGVDTLRGLLFSDLGNELRVTDKGCVQLLFAGQAGERYIIKIYAVPFESC